MALNGKCALLIYLWERKLPDRQGIRSLPRPAIAVSLRIPVQRASSLNNDFIIGG